MSQTKEHTEKIRSGRDCFEVRHSGRIQKTTMFHFQHSPVHIVAGEFHIMSELSAHDFLAHAFCSGDILTRE